jgi:5-methylcytosine-specific restriction endonuclease McrA
MSALHDALGRFVKGTHWREPQPFRDSAWLRENYVVRQRSTGDIAREFGVTDASVLFWLRRHEIARRDVSAARKVKHWGCCGATNPMWGKKGALCANWKGGATPERQRFYESQEWKSACRAVWCRDDARCRRCGRHISEFVKPRRSPLHVHHIVSFADTSRRADVDNLVLLCVACHRFVHSKQNVLRLFLPPCAVAQADLAEEPVDYSRVCWGEAEEGPAVEEGAL